MSLTVLLLGLFFAGLPTVAFAASAQWNHASALPFSIPLPNASVVTHVFANNFTRNARTGEVIHADDRSLMVNGKRWYPIAGEVQFARLPVAQWRETLLRMRAGGLDGISMYVTWIHHEEQRGKFIFEGRRNLRSFINLAGELGLKVLLRIGPWIHGEVRNGGHPDWLYAQNGDDTPPPCGNAKQLRTTDPAYLRCAKSWFMALAAQLSDGAFWTDGGPIWAVQVDNETRDFEYLLALQKLAVSVGVTPAAFTKTGWPAPTTPYPPDYPQLPYFGGYADNFFNNDMRISSCVPCYEFPRSLPGYKHVPGFPRLGIEIGGGMAASYSHRTHMEPDDMPAMHLVAVGSGFNGLGYYMYAGGNNPHSLLPKHQHRAALDFGDFPNETLQESSFQLRTLGMPNPMPSESYDFFAPLGEFGQPRPHYHSMRRLHQFATSKYHGWGHILVDTVAAVVDRTPLQWTVRTQGAHGSSFLFVNNYRRAAQLPVQVLQRFDLRWSSSSGRETSRLQIPSNRSDAIDIVSGVWFVWPIRVPLCMHVCASHDWQASTTPARIEWATAQLVTRIDISPLQHVVFLAQTRGVPTEIAIGGAGKVMRQKPGSTLSTETTDDGDTVHVLRGIHADSSYVPVMTVSLEASEVECSMREEKDVSSSTASSAIMMVSFVLLTEDEADRMYTDTAMNKTRVFLTAGYSNQGTNSASGGDDPRDLVLSDGRSFYLRHYTNATSTGSSDHGTQEADTTELLVCPAPGTISGVQSDKLWNSSVFSKVNVTLPSFGGLNKPSVKLVHPAPMPPRQVPLAPSGKPQEPSMSDWLSGAARYNITLPTVPVVPRSSNDYVEVRLAIDYEADSARLYYRGRLLTDNWFTGYTADGRMEVGLTFLADENPGLFDDQQLFSDKPRESLVLFVLPLKKATLEKNVWLQPQHWPAFTQHNGTVALSVNDVRLIVIVGTKLKL